MQLTKEDYKNLIKEFNPKYNNQLNNNVQISSASNSDLEEAENLREDLTQLEEVIYSLKNQLLNTFTSAEFDLNNTTPTANILWDPQKWAGRSSLRSTLSRATESLFDLRGLDQFKENLDQVTNNIDKNFDYFFYLNLCRLFQFDIQVMNSRKLNEFFRIKQEKKQKQHILCQNLKFC